LRPLGDRASTSAAVPFVAGRSIEVVSQPRAPRVRQQIAALRRAGVGLEEIAMVTVKGKARQPTTVDPGKIDEAVRALSLAQDELTLAVNDLVPVGDKQMITAALQRAFEKVRLAQEHVLGLKRPLARV
jgi:hypothetical protein